MIARALIAGAGGMLGQDVRSAAHAAGLETTALVHRCLDITDPDAVLEAVTTSRPQVVINCAAWTDVDGAETDPRGALAVNATGAGNLARAAHQSGAWTIHVSSDYVFDGTKREPYLESDATQPINAYGRSKLEGERAVALHAPDTSTIVRSSWLFGAGGACFPQTILRLAGERDEISVVDDQVGCPTFAGHLASALIELCHEPPPGVLHVAGSGHCSWFEFAVHIVASARLDCEVLPVPTTDMPRPAARPAYSVLRSERSAPELPEWRDGLAQYLAAQVAY
jgi:dTDP-4-dehydrorhamnose reductase